MDRRQNPRISVVFPVRIWGLDANALPFMQLATVRNISSNGAVVQGVSRPMRPGQVLEMQFGEEKAQFRVVWTGRAGTYRAGEVGLESLPAEPCIWNLDLGRHMQLAGNG